MQGQGDGHVNQGKGTKERMDTGTERQRRQMSGRPHELGGLRRRPIAIANCSERRPIVREARDP